MVTNIMQQNLSMTHCPECGSNTLIEDYDRGEVACGSCGLVIRESVMDTGPEWRAFTREQNAELSRIGPSTSLSVHDKGLATVIDRINQDAFGKQLPIPTRLQMRRLKQWQFKVRIHLSGEKNLSRALGDLNRLADTLWIPKAVKEEAALIYRRALKKGLVQGRSSLKLVAASLYAACRFTQTIRTLKEVAEASLTTKKSVASCYRLLLKELEIKMSVINPRECVSKIGSKINIDEKTQQTAMNIIRKAEETNYIVGKDPMGIAAAALYLAGVLAGEKKTQKEIADAAGVTEVTVRNRYKGLQKNLSSRQSPAVKNVKKGLKMRHNVSSPIPVAVIGAKRPLSAAEKRP